VTDLPDRASKSLADADAIIRVAERYVRAYQERDLAAMLAVMDENVVSHPAPLIGHRPHVGHAGVREWWAAMTARHETYDVVVSEIRQIDPGRVAVLGELYSEGKRLSAWAVLGRIRNGLIAESRSYLSDENMLDELALVTDATPTT
jgi:ketosteroid isomerase-like protein